MSGILAIDTASSSVIALAWHMQDETNTRELPGPQQHSRQLMTAIDEMLALQKARPAAIGVITGPGSFAGLRVGIATAESLALGWSVPVFGVSTFEAIARAADILQEFVAVHPAGRGEFACQRFARAMPNGEPFLAAAEALTAEGNFAGEGAGSMGGREVTAGQRVASVARIAAERVASGERPAGLEAFYLREPNITRPRRTPLVPTSN